MFSVSRKYNEEAEKLVMLEPEDDEKSWSGLEMTLETRGVGILVKDGDLVLVNFKAWETLIFSKI